MGRLLVMLVMLAGCDDTAPALLVEIRSDLSIPDETNSLVARVTDDGTTLEERTFPLGEAPNDVWPQTLPVLSGAAHPRNVMVAAELRITAPGMPSVAVGFGEVEAAFPDDGVGKVQLDVPRSCVDEDGDGFGIGFGCARPDCDDSDPRVPAEIFCPGTPLPDAGVKDAAMDGGPQDGGPDAGLDAGPDAGMPDVGELCGTDVCEADERCLNQQCLQECMENEDCGSFSYGCLPQFGVCICRVPCFDGIQDCGPYQCVDGCCEIN